MIWTWIARNKLSSAALGLVVILAIGLVGMWVAYEGESIRADRNAIKAQQNADSATQWAESYAQLHAATQQQAEAVRSIVERAGEASRAAQEALDRSARDSAALKARAAALKAQSKPPPGTDLCLAARDAFADELRGERPNAP